ncbi:hypothetical protein BDV59DRAFT_133069 [Aspergillus ambiguus]|uniref:shugoshin family protein n=1 Tax=Aspergillus ambiguus TaxID=176160 RepID=UPI003CCD9BB7
MARLNESAAPIESLESLKRRFVRQNREIARVNSIQSLRIRSLESEVSHLLAENVSLREQVITLGNELERFEAAKLLSDGVYDIKAKLDSKLAELNNIVSGLGALPRNFNKTISQDDGNADRNLSDHHSPALKPQPESNQDTEDDGRLPVILEDKYYPRKTLESSELRDLVNESASGSFESGAQITTELSPEEDNTQSKIQDDLLDALPNGDASDIDEQPLPTMLETRKKKRQSASLFGSISGTDHESITPKTENRYSLKSGAKRKFSSEDDDEFEPIATSDDDFQFSRPNQSPEAACEELHLSAGEETPIKRGTSPHEKRGTSAPPKRKALGPKSTNSRMVSAGPGRPRKGASRSKKSPVSVDSHSDENYTFQADKAKGTPITQHKTLNLDSDHDDPDATKAETVAAVSIPSFQASQDLIHSNDVSSSNQLETLARPSRRQRAIVSYAEPNLRAKMRRPTSEFIAAVGDGQVRRASGSQPPRKSVVADESGGNEEKEAQEPGTAHERPESPSFEVSGSSAEHQMATVSLRKRKTSPEKRDGRASQAPTEETIDALPLSISIDRKHQKEPVDHIATSIEGPWQEKESIVLDKPKSSTRNMLKATPGLNRQSRRHSSNPKASSQTTGTSGIDLQYVLNSTSSMASTLNNDSIQKGKALGSEADLDTEPMDPLGKDSTKVRRGQRAASRRRSMML